jgi:hypothetical protein
MLGRARRNKAAETVDRKSKRHFCLGVSRSTPPTPPPLTPTPPPKACPPMRSWGGRAQVLDTLREVNCLNTPASISNNSEPLATDDLIGINSQVTTRCQRRTAPGPTRRKKSKKAAPRGRLSLDNGGPHKGSAQTWPAQSGRLLPQRFFLKTQYSPIACSTWTTAGTSRRPTRQSVCPWPCRLP